MWMLLLVLGRVLLLRRTLLLLLLLLCEVQLFQLQGDGLVHRHHLLALSLHLCDFSNELLRFRLRLLIFFRFLLMLLVDVLGDTKVLDHFVPFLNCFFGLSLFAVLLLHSLLQLLQILLFLAHELPEALLGVKELGLGLGGEALRLLGEEPLLSGNHALQLLQLVSICLNLTLLLLQELRFLLYLLPLLKDMYLRIVHMTRATTMRGTMMVLRWMMLWMP
mmetsp:Transcript_58740/g.128958  ORF Transcript_58740/g.128958 Transcript_58740/m.128958 type:complete len:220 (-) Transcript_58740:601-1260(-)